MAHFEINERWEKCGVFLSYGQCMGPSIPDMAPICPALKKIKNKSWQQLRFDCLGEI